MSDLPPTFVKGFHDEAAVRRMAYNQLGKTSLMVSTLSIGGETLAPNYRHDDEEEAIKTIQKAIRSGINYIDTAPYYGQGRSEQIIGKALKDFPREAYYTATKVAWYGAAPPEQFDFSSKRTKKSIDISLKYLGLDYVDIIQIHDVEFAENLDIVINETLPAIEEAKAKGKAKFIGITGYPLHVLKEAILKAPGRFDTPQQAAPKRRIVHETNKEFTLPAIPQVRQNAHRYTEQIQNGHLAPDPLAVPH